MGKYFGTDGFRGEAGKILTAQDAFFIGRYLGWYFAGGKKRAKVAVGKDTRLSSYTLEYALVAGLTASGADAYLLHVTTTPSVSYVVKSDDFDCGVMISASHNPYTDNGIKIVNWRGEKTDDALIEKIEAYLDARKANTPDLPYRQKEEIGKIIDYVNGPNRYIGYLISLSLYSFKEWRVALDCANGSAWMIAKTVFDALGAKTHAINDTPDGQNINRDAGSTHIDGLCRYVRENKMDIGFAFDGDADRCIAVDENGDVVDGDKIMYLLAKQMKKHGELQNGAVVCTVMSNIGLVRALEKLGISAVETQVGDRFVYEKMKEGGYSIGGEQSGHVILAKYATTGDGILTAIQIMGAAIEEKATLSQLVKTVSLYPQFIKNVEVADKHAAVCHPTVIRECACIREELKENGRLIMRESGTEPVVRIMVEAESPAACEKYANRLFETMKEVGLC